MKDKLYKMMSWPQIEAIVYGQEGNPQTILGRHYVSKDGRNLFTTELGEAVNAMMVEAFPEIVDLNFTAGMERMLDEVEEGTVLAVYQNGYKLNGKLMRPARVKVAKKKEEPSSEE